MFDLDQTTGTEGGQEQSFQAGALVAPLHIRSICAARVMRMPGRSARRRP